MPRTIAIACLSLLATNALAQDPAQKLANSHTAPADAYSGKSEMHGHSFSEFKDFHRKWKQVTVRYRLDSHEMRFIYANDIAWRALTSGKRDYPDGAVFGKIGYISEEDKAFPSSIVPSGAKRFQFMVRDRKRFAETDGWGYLLFNGKGLTFPGNPVEAAKACAACHRIVPDRGYVFAEPVNDEPFVLKSAKQDAKPASAESMRVRFEDLGTESLPSELRRLLPDGTTGVRSVTGEMRKNLFEGTLNEIRPSLTKEALSSGKPAVLLSESGSLYSFAAKEKSARNCPPNEVSISYGTTVPSPTFTRASSGSESEQILKIGHYCHATAR